MPDLQRIGEIIQSDIQQILSTVDIALFRPLIKGEFEEKIYEDDTYVIITWEKLEDGNMIYSRTPLTKDQIEKFAKDKEFIHSREAKKIFERSESILVAMQDNVEIIAELDLAEEDSSLN